MNELERSFAAAKMAKESEADRSASLKDQSQRFWQLFKESVESTVNEINRKPELCKQALGPLKMDSDERGYFVYRITFPVYQIFYKDFGTHFTIDTRRKNITTDLEEQPRRVSSDVFKYELSDEGMIQVRTKDGMLFTEAEAAALHILSPFWK